MATAETTVHADHTEQNNLSIRIIYSAITSWPHCFVLVLGCFTCCFVVMFWHCLFETFHGEGRRGKTLRTVCPITIIIIILLLMRPSQVRALCASDCDQEWAAPHTHPWTWIHSMCVYCLALSAVITLQSSGDQNHFYLMFLFFFFFSIHNIYCIWNISSSVTFVAFTERVTSYSSLCVGDVMEHLREIGWKWKTEMAFRNNISE